MDRLGEALGLAPSEMSFEDLVRRCQERQTLIGGELFALRNAPLKKTARKAVRKPSEKLRRQAIDSALGDLGISSVEEMLQKLKEIKEKEER